jgi:hypothetical protein
VQRPAAARLIGGSLAILLALAQFRLIVIVFGADYGRAIQAARGVVEGTPHWRVYQGRVLSPYTIEGLSAVFPGFSAAHVFFSIALLAIAGWLAWRLGERLAARRGAVLALVGLHAVFALLLARPWLYAWDYVDVVVFLVFVDFVIQGRRWPWFAGLFAVGVLNHEVALFVALWMIADPVTRWALGRRGTIAPAPFDRGMALAGAGCLVAGMTAVEGLRRALLVEEIGPKIFVDAPPDAGSAFHFRLGDNLRELGELFTRWDYGMPIVIPALLVLVVLVAVALAARDARRYAGLAVTHVALIGSLLAFGLLHETRIYVVLIPILVAGAVVLTAGPGPDPAPPDA